MCWPKTDVEGSIESTSQGDARKDWQQTVGGKAGVEEIDSALKIGRESLSETLRATPTQSAKQQTNQTNKQTKVGQLGRRGTQEAGHKREKRSKEKEEKHRTKVMEHQINCLAQRVEDKGRRGGSEGHPSSHLCGAHKDLNPCKVQSHIGLPC
jgi:DNA-directed RNA polymerase specialized sigma subunit